VLQINVSISASNLQEETKGEGRKFNGDIKETRASHNKKKSGEFFLVVARR
jgi:hypothetical protein